MVIIRTLLLLTLFGCAKTSYLFHQSIGQLKIFTKSKENSKLLKSVKVEQKVKDKILYIEELKKYFFEYWEKDVAPIYTKTTILDQKAVTYLVITSDFHKIKANKECFPFMGCFPYLGFFNLEHAKEYAKDKESEGQYSYIRPVYAYSTLGYFDDPILSSFFNYNKFDLTELIFHELFHTIYFYKDKVQLNENLANYFGKQMALEYYKKQGWSTSELAKREENSAKIRKKLVELTKQYESRLNTSKVKNRKQADQLLEKFMQENFKPQLQAFCAEIKSENCYPLKRKWNNASLAAYLTYEEESDRIEAKVKKENWTLKQFFSYIERLTKQYEDNPKDLEEHLFKL